MKLVLFSDLHLDAPFSGLRPDLARMRRQRLREVLQAIANLTRESGADALLCGGDLFEHQRTSADSGAFLRRCFADLHPLPVFIAPGNHDWLGPASLYRIVQWSPNVTIFDQDRLTPVTLSDGLTLWGAAHRAPANTDGFLERFRIDRGGIHLALFHGSELGSLGFQGEGKMPHAPFRAAQIENAGIHHAFLGHYHSPRDEERFTYPGNPEPLSFGEQGRRGAVIVTVAGDGSVSRERRLLALTQLHDLPLDLTGCASQQEVRERVAQAIRGLSGVVRVTLGGDLAPEVALRPQDLNDAAPWLDQLIVREGALGVAYDIGQIKAEPTVRGQFVRDVLAAPDLDEGLRQRILVTGLRALDGREDLEL